jgi:ABC-type branched-subunit amino acid transport system substrate-binding protein
MRRRTLIVSTTCATGTALCRPAWAATNDVVVGRFQTATEASEPALRDFLAGVQLGLDNASARGGIFGRKLRWTELDTQQPAALLIAKAQRLATEPGFLAWLGAVGPAQAATLQQMPPEGRAPVVGGAALADHQRAAMRGWHFHVRATQAREAEVLARHLATLRLTRVALVGRSDPTGSAQAATLGRALAQAGIQTLAQAVVTPDAATVQEAARKLLALDPQALVLALPAAQAFELMDMAAALNRHPGFYSVSMGGEEARQIQRLKNPGGLAITQVVPYPWSQTDAQILAWRRQCEPAMVPVGYASLEGYITAQVLVEALRRCGRDLSRGALLASLTQLQMHWGGMDIDFNRGEAGGSRFVELVQVAPGGRYTR